MSSAAHEGLKLSRNVFSVYPLKIVQYSPEVSHLLVASPRILTLFLSFLVLILLAFYPIYTLVLLHAGYHCVVIQLTQTSNSEQIKATLLSLPFIYFSLSYDSFLMCLYSNTCMHRQVISLASGKFFKDDCFLSIAHFFCLDYITHFSSTNTI